MNPDRVLESFLEMVAIESPSWHEAPMAAYCAEKLAEMGVSQEYIDTVFPKISGFGNKDGAENKDGSYTAQIVFYAPEDIQAVAEAIYEKLKDCPSLKEVKALKAKDLQERTELIKYLKENEIHAVAAVTIRPEDYEKAKEVMLYIIEKLGGYFCGDTADFTPVVAAKKN